MRLDAMETEELPGGYSLATARGAWQRGRGLARMDSLPARHGLKIPRCSSVHTFAMRFPLDLVWLDREGSVVRIDHDVAPRSLRSCRGARELIEVNAGEGEAFAAALRSPGVMAPP